jgi:hypothetical protein
MEIIDGSFMEATSAIRKIIVPHLHESLVKPKAHNLFTILVKRFLPERERFRIMHINVF